MIGLGIALDSSGHGEEAIAAFRRAVETNLDMAEARRDLAIALLRHNDFSEAAAELQQAISRHPDDPVTHYLAGQTFEIQGHTAEAHAEYERTLQLDPSHTLAREGLRRTAR